MFVTVDGIKLHYETCGTGNDVLVMHGWGCSIQTVKPIISLLCANFRVTALDLPGCGESDEPPAPFSVDDYGRIMVEFIRQTNIKNPILIGHSNGGRVAIYLNAVSKIPVRKNILIDAAGIKAKPTLKKSLRKYVFKAVKGFLTAPLWKAQASDLLDKARGAFGSSDYNSATPVMRQTLVKLLNEDLTPHLHKISAPTLLIWGDNDTATPLSDGKLMEKLIPGSGLVVLGGTGHYSYLEKPQQFAAVLNSFLAEDKG